MTATSAAMSLHDTVTARIISELEAGCFPWVQPWASASPTPLGLPQNAATGRTYSGINILLLWCAALEQGRPSQRWLTFKQALALGGARRKGERARWSSMPTLSSPSLSARRLQRPAKTHAGSAFSSGTPCSTSPSATGCRRTTTTSSSQPAQRMSSRSSRRSSPPPAPISGSG